MNQKKRVRSCIDIYISAFNLQTISYVDMYPKLTTVYYCNRGPQVVGNIKFNKYIYTIYLDVLSLIVKNIYVLST